MKSRKPWLPLIAASSLLFAGSLLAQNQPMPPTPPPPPPAPAASQAAEYQNSQGELTVHSAPAPAPQVGPAPPFTQLSAGGRGITEQQAVAYPPLANDFIHADRNRNGSISMAEYKAWSSKP